MADEPDNVRSLGAKRATAADDNRLWTPLECLDDAVRDLKSGAITADKLMVVFVDTSNEQFVVKYYASKFRASEMIAAIEIAKNELLKSMGYL